MNPKNKVAKVKKKKKVVVPIKDTLEIYITTESGARIGTALKFHRQLPWDAIEDSIWDAIKALRELLVKDNLITELMDVEFKIK